MPPRTRFACWIAAVAGCALSPILFNLIAPWAGAAWQCLCLGAILALYATTPADAIKLPKWVSKIVIVGGMVAWPWLCHGQVTWAMLVAALVVFVADHVALRSEWRGEHRVPAWTGQTWRWRPGIASDWITVSLLWSPFMWWTLLDAGANLLSPPQVGVIASLACLGWLFAFQLPTTRGAGLESRDPRRIWNAAITLMFSVPVVLIHAME